MPTHEAHSSSSSRLLHWGAPLVLAALVASGPLLHGGASPPQAAATDLAWEYTFAQEAHYEDQDVFSGPDILVSYNRGGETHLLQVNLKTVQKAKPDATNPKPLLAAFDAAMKEQMGLLGRGGWQVFQVDDGGLGNRKFHMRRAVPR